MPTNDQSSEMNIKVHWATLFVCFLVVLVYSMLLQISVRMLAWCFLFLFARLFNDNNKIPTGCGFDTLYLVGYYQRFGGTHYRHLQGRISSTLSTLKMKIPSSINMLVSTYKTIRYRNPQHHNLKYTQLFIFVLCIMKVNIMQVCVCMCAEYVLWLCRDVRLN
jgi:hypothetical protein